MKQYIGTQLARVFNAFNRIFRISRKHLTAILAANVYFGRNTADLPGGSIVFFPYRENLFFCGIAAIVSYKQKKAAGFSPEAPSLDEMVSRIGDQGYAGRQDPDFSAVQDQYLGGDALVESLWQTVQILKHEDHFFTLYADSDNQINLENSSKRLSAIIEAELRVVSDHIGRMASQSVELMTARIEKLKDITWCIDNEVLNNIRKIKDLCRGLSQPPQPAAISIFKRVNAVLNSIDRLEVRGRDSAGISLMFILNAAEFEAFENSLKQANLYNRLENRSGQDPLVNRGISIHRHSEGTAHEQIAISIVYKVAHVIGSLGDNVAFLRRQISDDPIFQILAACSVEFDTVSAHTRWASVGAITEANCHPVDNQSVKNKIAQNGIIHTCLNGDIDNFQELKREFELSGDQIQDRITTDTKIIPLVIQNYITQGQPVEEAFRLAVNNFQGSHAISMHTNLAPGKIFLAQKGSGQALFVGIAPDHYIPASEVYGFVEETPDYIKLDGETVVSGEGGSTQGQVFILNQQSPGALAGIRAMYYDGSALELSEDDLKHTEITSRDIDRQAYPHYFLKEISESPDSMEKTLQNRWKVSEGQSRHTRIVLDDSVIPPLLKDALQQDQIKRIYFIGQGTAGVAALACANILSYYMDSTIYQVGALKASEFSGFHLNENDDPWSMADALVIAISQSGTTTDTNRTVDMVKERGAYTLAIVNRRDSDITFKVDGVMYTSSGRDIEMSVASTKAFYSQIVAGAVLGLYMAALKNRRTAEFVTEEIQQLQALPAHMRQVLAAGDVIRESADRYAVTKTYWAAVGSGPNKASADEIRIKLSELCYKTISSDFVEDKKHIDLSSEPLIIVCAAGTRNTVIGDIIKDTAIFKAHKAIPIVIADEGENRFDPYAETVFHVPRVPEHLAPILNTLVGHIWGYYAALSINEGSRFLFGFQDDIKRSIDEYSAGGLDVYEIILEQPFREKVAAFYNEFRKKRAAGNFPVTIGMDISSDLTLLLKYLSGRLPVSDFDLDFNQKGTAVNMLNTLFACLAEAISIMARPVDAIKHQAKTVTVGTSRITDRLEGILFDKLRQENFAISQLTNSNIIVLKNLQQIIDLIKGTTLYQIDGLSVLGEPAEDTTIAVVRKRGEAAAVSSRVESDKRLKGTKRIIVRQGNVYIGKGRKDERSILVIPILTISGDSPNRIEHLMLLHVSFKADVALDARIKALGGKYEHIKNIVQENSLTWQDQHLDLVEIEELFGRSAEKIGEFIVARLNGRE
ncbi:glutamine--fructose-6-phosphate aminotransferase [Alkalispirochaeta odontotermitis]|nr:glutamine--fructose-6-phosphate aminotransferase [Alkalispirochaeta odontotermitis]CAB1075834.1 Glutamine--fructose-6-phosphate aminotransferase [isomerizing] (EC [Olavius algarvensis Delta 1 endosymbiont]